jgi:hypothetical protein
MSEKDVDVDVVVVVESGRTLVIVLASITDGGAAAVADATDLRHCDFVLAGTC